MFDIGKPFDEFKKAIQIQNPFDGINASLAKHEQEKQEAMQNVFAEWAYNRSAQSTIDEIFDVINRLKNDHPDCTICLIVNERHITDINPINTEGSIVEYISDNGEVITVLRLSYDHPYEFKIIKEKEYKMGFHGVYKKKAI